MIDNKFLEYIKEQRNDFVRIAGTYSITGHLQLRTEIDSLLIAYDQMYLALCQQAKKES